MTSAGAFVPASKVLRDPVSVTLIERTGVGGTYADRKSEYYSYIDSGSNRSSTGEQAFDGQEVSQRGAEMRWIIQREGPLSCESPISYLRHIVPLYLSVNSVFCSFWTVSARTVPD